MAKTLCKYSRYDIKAGKAEPLVANAQFYCTSCARSSNQKKALCKPVTLDTKQKVNEPLLSMSYKTKPMAHKTASITDVVAKAKALKQQRDYLEQVRIEEKGNGVNVVIPPPLLEKSQMPIQTNIKLSMKNLKVSLKVQKKQQKKIKKLIKIQRKLMKQHKKLLKKERKLTQQQAKVAQREERIEKRLTYLVYKTGEASSLPFVKPPIHTKALH